MGLVSLYTRSKNFHAVTGGTAAYGDSEWPARVVEAMVILQDASLEADSIEAEFEQERNAK